MFQLHDVVLQRLIVEKFTDEVPESPSGLAFSVEGKGERIDDTTGYSFLTVKMYFEEPNPKLFDVEIKIKGLCSKKEAEPSEHFDEFLNANALPLLWPFAREIVWNMLIRMDFPPIILPTINVTGTIKANLTIENE